MFDNFYKNKKVLITGHTGFKGSWLSLWLNQLGAQVYGYALEPNTDPNLFELAGIDDITTSTIADIRDSKSLQAAMADAKPEIVIHMAAQPLVRESYLNPVETYEINVMGTVNVLEAVKQCDSVRAVINVTTDKCYDNREWVWGYRENEPFGGFDPYSSSKACSELVTAAYRQSFFNPHEYDRHGVALASARAGNVIGGGDWSADRLISDCVRALLKKQKIFIRNPRAIRPWQHVLEPLSGYLHLAEKLYHDGVRYAEAWNFGPHDSDAREVEWIVNKLCKLWGNGAQYEIDKGNHPHEATYLKLDCSKARSLLQWQPRWNLEQTLQNIVSWTQGYQEGKDVRSICLEQIAAYQETKKEI
jgi:CDP-glucose 4,6-dehydratase